MDNICLICGQNFNDLSSLNGHIRSHKVTQEKYYTENLRKKDLLTGELIPFKNAEQYLDTDFNSEESMVMWFKKNNGQNCVKDYLIKKIKDRKEKKELNWAMTQVELRTIFHLGISYIQKNFGKDYLTFCAEFGFNNRFSKMDLFVSNENFPRDLEIYCDTREQMPLKFNAKTRSTKLDFADYTLSDKNYCGNIYIERKSVGDLYGTIASAKGMERFEKELERAKSDGAYIIILVEGNFKEVSDYTRKLKLNPYLNSLLFHNIRDLLQKNKDIQFLFVENRTFAARMIEQIFRTKGDCKNVDLQFQYDLGKLI